MLADGNGVFNENQICKAGIATIMHRNPVIIKIDHVKEDSVFLSYIRQDDQTEWKYKCKIEGNRIVWGAADGRWRTHPLDSKITFTVSINLITVSDRFSDGSSIEKTFTLEQVNN